MSGDTQREFLMSPVCVQRADTGRLLVTTDGVRRWMHAWWHRSALAAAEHIGDPAELDCALLTGAQLRAWLRQHLPDAGVLLHTHHAEHVVLPPQPRRRRSMESESDRYSDLVAPARAPLRQVDAAADQLDDVAAGLAEYHSDEGRARLNHMFGGDQRLVATAADLFEHLGGLTQDLAHSARTTTHTAAEMQREQQAHETEGDDTHDDQS